jgi:hypothetical protein
MATQPIVTIGGVPVTVLSAVISPGSTGPYQIDIQFPATVPTGAVALQASVGGVQSPQGSHPPSHGVVQTPPIQFAEYSNNRDYRKLAGKWRSRRSDAGLCTT